MKHIRLVSQKPVMAQSLLEAKLEFFGIAFVQLVRTVFRKTGGGDL